jgi:site-specific recombinase XerD
MFEEEIQQILKGVVNIRHKVILSTIYSGGLRTGELIKLPIKAIDSQRMQIRIEGAKERKTVIQFYQKKYRNFYESISGIQPALLPI